MAGKANIDEKGRVERINFVSSQSLLILVSSWLRHVTPVHKSREKHTASSLSVNIYIFLAFFLKMQPWHVLSMFLKSALVMQS